MGAGSEVWEHFHKRNNDTKAECRKCHAYLTYKNTTSNLISHLKTHGITINKLPPKGGRKRRFNPGNASADEEGEDVDDPDSPEKRQRSASPSQPSTSSGASGSATAGSSRRSSSSSCSSLSRKTGPLDQCVNNFSAFAPGGPRDVQCTNALVYMICKDNMPLSTPEREGFRKFVSTLQPLFKIPSEDSLTRWLDDKYEYCKKRVVKRLKEADHIVLTMDLWTQKHTMRSHLGVTAHYTRGGKCHSVELGTETVDERKTTATLREKITKFANDWEIDRSKVRAVVTDGGANIKAAAKAEFGDAKHISCFAHRLNLIGQKIIGNYKYASVPSETTAPPVDLPDDENDIQDDDDDDDVDVVLGSVRELILKLKKIVRFFKHSEIASTRLKDIQKAEMGKTDATALSLINEVVTRWNSCFDMCDRYLLLAPIVNRVCYEMVRDKNCKSKPPEMLTPDEEETLKEVRDLLAPLARATKEVSGDKIMTLSKCIPIIRNLNHEIGAFLPTTGLGFNMKQDLLNLVKEYFGNVEEAPMFAAATLLDPRFKKFGFSQDMRTPVRVARAVTFVANLVKDKMAEADREAAEPTEAAGAGAGEGDDAADDDFWSAFDREVQTQSAQLSGQDTAGNIPIQLRMYLDRPLVPRKDNPDPLQAWQPFKAEYKYVYAVAEEYLSILATSVPAERLFSHAGWIAHQRRTRLAARRLSMLIFLRSLPEELWF